MGGLVGMRTRTGFTTGRGKRPWSAGAAVALVLTVCVACGSGSEGSVPATDARSTTTAADGPGGIDASLTRDDVGCDAETLGEDDTVGFITARYVVDGTLGEVCFGANDPTVTKAWKQLAAITPPDQLTDLALFAGFTAADGGEGEGDTTLAFVNTLDDDGTVFQMSVNLDAYDDDPDEAALTMAHEFSHVFTAIPSQIDRTAVDPAACGAYYNGEGCYLPDSLMAAWTKEFWSAGDLASIDPNKEVGIADGEPRCAIDPSFLGPYAATTPEEDFAETFSAFVYGVEAPTPEVQAKFDWMAEQPGLAEFRDRADAAGVTPLEGSFEGCGN